MSRLQRALGTDGSDWVVLPAKEYTGLLDQVAASRSLIQKLLEQLEPGHVVPYEVRNAIELGKRPIPAWRQYRGMSQSALAAAAGISAPALHYIEHQIHYGRHATRVAIAEALDAPLWSLDPQS